MSQWTVTMLLNIMEFWSMSYQNKIYAFCVRMRILHKLRAVQREEKILDVEKDSRVLLRFPKWNELASQLQANV